MIDLVGPMEANVLILGESSEETNFIDKVGEGGACCMISRLAGEVDAERTGSQYRHSQTNEDNAGAINRHTINAPISDFVV